MDPWKAAAGLQRLLADVVTAAPPPGVDRDGPEFTAFMQAQRKADAFAAEHEPELATLREPQQDMTPDRFQERLAEMDTELDWLEAHADAAGNAGPAQEAYQEAWIDRTAFAANYDPEIRADPDAGPEIG